ncbi:MAG: 50S ribosomal protein L4 [Candidatus Veblenbacteria bacterium]|nr:50S ribosomal protein L4 [Candidatus Veblenbacteria bacterium]MDZ4230091.1 50S ribosomal protein L4 [Candidatus Veblenbacteria bacterium]
MATTDHITVVNAQGEAVRELALPEAVRTRSLKSGLVHQVVVAYAANRRAGTAHTKTRDEVAGGGRKPWRQKGTGRARHGSIRSPLWVGGGVVFGPRSTRNYTQRLPRELKNQARAMVVGDYLASAKVTVVNELPQADKTKVFATLFKDLKLSGRRTLVLLTSSEQSLRRGLMNLPKVEVMGVREFNAYDGLRYPRWLVSQAGAAELIKFV